MDNNLTANQLNLNSKQEIFKQIDSDILSQKAKVTRAYQKTKSNYIFVWILDFFVICIALFGIIIVYNIFQEAHIQLVVGRDAVKTLESTLLEQIDKQFRLDLAARERELDFLRQQLLELKGVHQSRISQIRAESELELVRQKRALIEDFQSRLDGSNDEEQNAIQLELEDRLVELEEQLRQNMESQIQQTQEEYERATSEVRTSEEVIQNELQETTQQQTEVQFRLTQVGQQETTNVFITAFRTPECIEFDNRIIEQIIQVQSELSRSNYSLVNSLIVSIQNEYSNTDFVNQERRRVDLYFLSLIQEYVSLVTNVSNEVMPQNEQIMVVQEKMARFTDQMLNNNLSDAQGNQEIQSLTEDLPNIQVFLDQYLNFRNRLNISNSSSISNVSNFNQFEQLLRTAREYYQKKNYTNAINMYQQILTEFEPIPQQEVVVKELYESFAAEMAKFNNQVNAKAKNTDIVYVRNPQGLIVDIIGDIVIISLVTPNIVLDRQRLFIFRPIQGLTLQFESIGEIFVSSKGVHQIQATKGDTPVQIGDMVYFQNPLQK